jgi:hypothetical protein
MGRPPIDKIVVGYFLSHVADDAVRHKYDP